ncbi:TonB-dependent receptor plug domain-containing protein [Caulobacter sp. RL271]|jgi:iron complex outermembrane receptor protein|uniref:TonB-dependent receptor n=1 Tax=Caulobacter segnis TaxID=88688 RepID=A0ABY4ZPV0_9CAUL|nr:TonB-dependent receptor [Caulobacter segnis]USQ94618.1 TonB-dependent receptor [Caulobacter segnis]
MLIHRRHLLASTIIAGLAVGAALPAMAQTAAPLQTTQDAAKASDNAEVEAVVVTGSRIKRSAFNSPDPIQVISAEQGQLRGIATATGLLQSSTIASGSPQVTSAISSALVTDGGPGSETVSLRGLGPNRTLVLLNGRRAGPAGTRGGVSAFDLNVLPLAVIDHVDILKDGASSIYGSDAVAGVVNIITKRDTDGIDAEMFYSQPQKHGGEQYSASASFAKTFDRGFFSLSYEYFKKAEQSNGQRSYTDCGRSYITDSSGKRKDTIDPRTGQVQCRDRLYDQIWLYDFNFSGLAGKLQYDYTGKIGGLIPRVPAGGGYPGAPAGFYVVGYSDDPQAADIGVLDYNSPFNLAASLTPRTERNTIFAQGAFDITSSVEAYGEILLNRRATKTNGYRQFWSYQYTGDYDPFSAGFTGDYILSPTPVTNRSRAGQRVDYQRYVGGLRGDFGGIDFLKGWDWDIFTQYSHSKGLYSQDVILQDAVDSADGRRDGNPADPSTWARGLGARGNSIIRPTASCAGYVTPISKRQCVDVSWVSPDFLAGKYTPAEEAFLFDTETGKTIYKQLVFEGSVSGNLFKLPAGDVGVALGFHYRKDSINDTPGAITLAGNSWGLSAAGVTKGDDLAREVYGELSVPLLKDMFLAERLDLSLSGRHTKVNSYGEDDTYKIGLNWQIIPSLRLRATRGTSFRAPALFELYKNAQTDFVSQRLVDPCIRWGQNLAQGNITQRVADNCRADGIPDAYTGQGAQATTTSSGGKGNLEAETSLAKTYGVIWTPKFADLQVAVDYFDINVKNEVTQLGSDVIVKECYKSLNFPTDKLCSLFKRDPGSHLVTDITDNYINIAEQINRGIDLTVRYGVQLPWDIRMTTELQSTWQLKDTEAKFADTVKDLNGLVGDPDWTGQLNLSFQKGDWTGFWGIDMVGKASDAETEADTNAAGTLFYKIHTEFTAYHNVSLRRQFEGWSITGGVSNLFDEHPPAVSYLQGQYSTVGGSVLSSQYDYLGRRAFLNIKAHF